MPADVYAAIMEAIATFRTENNEAIKRIHERLDKIVENASPSRKECEDYRTACRVCMNGKIEKAAGAAGVPKWALIVGSIGSSVLTGLIMYVVIGK